MLHGWVDTPIIPTAESVCGNSAIWGCSKSAGILLDADGAGTKKVVREYKVSPDTIKELPPLHAILYDKQEPVDIKMLKVPFIEF